MEQRCQIRSNTPQLNDKRITFTHRCLVMTDLPIDHMAHGHTNLHACPLDMVEIEMMKNGQADSGQ